MAHGEKMTALEALIIAAEKAILAKKELEKALGIDNGK